MKLLISFLLLSSPVFAQHTFKEFIVYRVAVNIQDHSDHGTSERSKIGDIVDARPERSTVNGVGSGETKDFIWLRLRGFSRDKMDRLTDIMEDTTAGKIYDKRRYYINLEDLKKQFPAFDIARAKDANDFYQPFYITNKQKDANWGYEFLIRSVIFDARGLVFDKQTRLYW